MRFFLVRPRQYAKLHMAEENDGKDREKLPKIEAAVLRQVLRICPKTIAFRDFERFSMRFFVIRRGHYAKLHMAKEDDAKDREKLLKIEVVILGRVLRECLKTPFPMRNEKKSNTL